MIRFRRFRNTDPPALAELWNRAAPRRAVVRPLGPHEFDAIVIDNLGFEADGLIIAERDGGAVGFVHAGFGPLDPRARAGEFDRSIGTIAQLIIDVEPGREDAEVEIGLIHAAEAYLRGRGASVIYAGGQDPVNPFYASIYGGSEFAGILSAHDAFLRAVMRRGFEPVSTSVILEADLSRPEPRDPRSTILRRQVHWAVSDDAKPDGWWQELAIGLYQPDRIAIQSKSDDVVIASAKTWGIAGGCKMEDGRARAGLIDVEVDPSFRRKGYGRLLLTEAFRHARSRYIDLMVVATRESNEPALALYKAMGFKPIETATLFRLPGSA